MEVGTEISQKIRSAIKAKLMELGAYVDDELPDYIMVMVANKKNKSQMKTDLSLFLGANTDTFTSWLHGLLGKLQTLTVDSVKDKPESEKPKKEKKKDKNGSGGQKSKGDSTKSKKAGKEKSRKRKSSKDVVDEAPKAKAAMSETVEKENTTTEITTETMVDENQILSEESSQVAANQSDQVELEANSVQQTNVQEEVEDVRQLLVAATPGDDLAKELDAVEEEISNVKKSGALSNSKNVDTSKKVVMSNVPAASDNAHDSKTKRKVPLSVVATVSRDEDDEEYDPFNPAVGSVASVVKVTSRKASFPPSMQANRALLVKAMSDAEKSVATKRKVAVTRPINRQSSPGEYSPKRKRSSSNKETASPPPYIPSRKMGASPATSSHSRGSGVVFKQKVLSQDDIRHTLGRDGSRSLLSASRRQELGRKTVNENSAPSYHSTPSFHKRSTKDAEGSKSKTSSLDGGAHSREVKSLEKMSGEVKNFQITARVGPLQSAPSKENTPETVESDSDEGLRVTVISGQGGKVSSQLDSVPVSAVKKSQTLSRSSDKTRSAVGTIKKSKQRENLLTENKSRGVRVISKLAREAVQKQCKAAVMSVTKATSVSTRASSPDSRVVQCDSKPPSVDSEQEEGSDANEPQDEDISASEDSDTKVVIQKSPTPSVSPDKVIPIVSPTRRQSIKKDVEEVEDLSQMLEEDLDNELLLEEEDKNEFTLDLDDEELSHVVEEVAAEIEPQPEKDESKSGIRFIVTLDGIDEARFDDKSSKSVTNVAGAQAIRPMNTNPSPSHNQLVTTLPPSTPTRPLLPAAVTSPQLTSTPAQVANKIRPPKIQPFSISLRDSDDEHEEKVVTYIQASDAAALESTGGREPSVLQQARSQERCRYWPACMAGSDCQYHHPTTHCKTFPNCKFGDKCLFIHPNCKFDSKCVRADCPFTHTSKRHVSQLVAPTMPPSRIYPRYPSVPHTHHQAATCHFFPNCLNPNCTFVHPKPCMYGLACKNPTCTFYHPAQVSPPIVTSTVPDKKKLKWQAQQTTQLKVAAVKPSATRSATVSSTSL